MAWLLLVLADVRDAMEATMAALPEYKLKELEVHYYGSY